LSKAREPLEESSEHSRTSGRLVGACWVFRGPLDVLLEVDSRAGERKH